MAGQASAVATMLCPVFTTSPESVVFTTDSGHLHKEDKKIIRYQEWIQHQRSLLSPNVQWNIIIFSCAKNQHCVNPRLVTAQQLCLLLLLLLLSSFLSFFWFWVWVKNRPHSRSDFQRSCPYPNQSPAKSQVRQFCYLRTFSFDVVATYAISIGSIRLALTFKWSDTLACLPPLYPISVIT